MDKDAHSLREELYRVIQYYAELTQLAQKGEVNPIGQIGKIIKKTSPYLLLVIRDLLPNLERDVIGYHEALHHMIRVAQNFEDQSVLMESRNEIQKIEKQSRIFVYAVKWLDSQSNLRPSAQEMDLMVRRLSDYNEKYKKRYSEDTTTLIPCFFRRQEGESHDASLKRLLDLVRRAILEMHHLMMENEPEKRYYFFSSETRKEIEDDIMSLAWFMLRSGYTVDRIASGYYKDHLSDFLNCKLLDHLIAAEKNISTIQGISTTLYTISLIDFSSFFEISLDYINFDDSKEVQQRIRLIKTKNRRGAAVLKRMCDLHKLYTGHPQGRLPLQFLLFRYYISFGDYHGEHRPKDPRSAQAVEIYKPIVDRSNVEKRAEADLEESGGCFSSKTREEMAGLLKLLMDSLEDPGRMKGKKVKVLGDISSGAMGKVSIGIFRNQIVALKKVKTDVAASLGDPMALLEYEAAMHARIQTPEQHPYVVEYFGLVEQDNEKLLINGYYPNDNLTQLVEKNWQEKYKPPFAVESKLSLGTMELVINQLLECLRIFRDKGLVHRDLKTDNILYMVDENERLNRLKVIDFGVALPIGPGAIEDYFKGKVVGTFAYMAPEQARGRSVFQSDLYSVGAIFTVLLTGKLPMVFPKTKTRNDLVKQIIRIEQEPRPKLTDLNPWLNRNTTFEHIAATVESMLDLDPMRRPNLEECQAAFDGVFQHIGQEKHALSVFYHKG